MINKKIALAIFFFMMLVLSIFITVAGNVVQKKFMSNKNTLVSIQDDLLSIGDNSTVRVFVRLKDESQKLVEKGNFRVMENEVGKSFSALLNKSEIEELNSHPRVQSITRVPIRYINLQESVSLINATITYPLQVNAFNLTGNGQTICIIDTGVNYSHPSLGGCYGNNNLSSTCKIIGGWDYCSNDASCGNEDNDPMDVNGHGTHVAGIVAANGSINGVAPDAKIIMIKAGNSSGAFWDEDLLKALDWCIGNSSTFNISVISMSLGGQAYNNYCDDNLDGDGIPSGDNYDYVTRLNSAISKNISVVIASGNDGYSNAISAPACLEGAIPVTSTNKGDNAISSFANTWNDSSLNILAAPGENINSTYGGTYLVVNGTSMATPHVAGTIALMRQYLYLVNRTKTPYQIENTLNNTGKIISDSSSGLNFSRINVYDAIISLDIDYPNVSLISPSNSIISDSVNQTFRCNATDLMLKNMTFYLWNSSSVYNSSYKELSDNEDSFEINITNINEGSYKWNCYYYDKNNNLGYYSSNYTLNISLLNINLVSPSNSSGIKQNQTFTCNASSNVGLSNVSFYLWNSTGLEYNVMSNITGLTNDSSISYNFTHEDKYDWNCLFMNNLSSQSYFSYNYTLYYDLTNPNVSLVSPSEGYSATGTQTVAFEFNVTDNINASSCDLILSGSNVSNNNSVRNGIGYISYSLNVGSYSWSINCTDYANNIGNSSLRTLTINQESSGGGSGGGGGGGGGGATNMVYSINNAQINEGYVKEIKKSDMIKFNLNTGGNFSNHSLTLTGLTNYSVNILVKSEPIELTLYVGEEKKVSVDSIDKYNLFVKLNSINLGKANLTIKQIDEGISVITPIENESIPLENKGNNKIFGESPSNYYWYAIPAIILLIFVGYFIRRFRKTRRKMPESKVPQHGANKRGLANI